MLLRGFSGDVICRKPCEKQWLEMRTGEMLTVSKAGGTLEHFARRPVSAAVRIARAIGVT